MSHTYSALGRASQSHRSSLGRATLPRVSGIGMPSLHHPITDMVVVVQMLLRAVLGRVSRVSSAVALGERVARSGEGCGRYLHGFAVVRQTGASPHAAVTVPCVLKNKTGKSARHFISY